MKRRGSGGRTKAAIVSAVIVCVENSQSPELKDMYFCNTGRTEKLHNLSSIFTTDDFNSYS